MYFKIDNRYIRVEEVVRIEKDGTLELTDGSLIFTGETTESLSNKLSYVELVPPDSTVVGGGDKDTEPSINEVTPPSTQKNLYVSNQLGMPNALGTKEDPFLSVRNALDTLSTIDDATIHLFRGEKYEEDITPKSHGGSAGSLVFRDWGDPALDKPIIKEGIILSGSGGAPERYHNLWFKNIVFVGKNTGTAMNLIRGGTNLYIIGCVLSNFSTGLSVNGFDSPWEHVLISDCVISDNKGSERSQGIFTKNTHNLTIQRTLVHNNGMDAPNIFKHGIYIQNDCSNVQIKKCWINNNSSHGLQLRCGGSVTNTFFTKNAIQCLVGGGDNPNPGGVGAVVDTCVLAFSRDIGPNTPRGWNIELENVNNGLVNKNMIYRSNGGMPRYIYISEVPETYSIVVSFNDIDAPDNASMIQSEDWTNVTTTDNERITLLVEESEILSTLDSMVKTVYSEALFKSILSVGV